MTGEDWAAHKFETALADLAANILRVLARGGKQRELIAQARAVIDAAEDPNVRVADELTDKALPRGWAKGEDKLRPSRDAIIQAALRVVAARLQHHPPDIWEQKLIDAIDHYNAMGARRR